MRTIAVNDRRVVMHSRHHHHHHQQQQQQLHHSGVAGPLAAQGGGQICRAFVLGF